MLNHGYFMHDLYPNIGALSTSGVTIPEPEEQMVMDRVDPEDKAPKQVSAAASLNLWTWMGLVLILMILMHIGR